MFLWEFMQMRKKFFFWIEINKPQNNRPLVASRSACIWCGKCNCRNNEDEDCYHLIIIHNFFERDLYAAIVHNCENLKRSFLLIFQDEWGLSAGYAWHLVFIKQTQYTTAQRAQQNVNQTRLAFNEHHQIERRRRLAHISTHAWP